MKIKKKQKKGVATVTKSLKLHFQNYAH